MYRKLVAVAFIALTAACASSGVTLTRQFVDTAYSPNEFGYAGAGRDLRVVVAGNPFGGDAAAFGTAVTDAMQRSHLGQRTHFTTSPGETAREGYRVLMLFNPPNALNSMRLCREEPSALPTEATGDGIAVYGAFCRDDKALTSIKGHASSAAAASDPAFADLVGQVTTGLFPPERDRDRNQRCPPFMQCN